MKIVADTNWLVAAYIVKLDQPRTEIVHRFIERCDLPWIVPPPALIEARSVFASYTNTPKSPEWERLKGDLGHKLLPSPHSWEEIALKAEELSDRFSPKARVGTLDLLILAAAVKAEATHFLSFDSNSNTRGLAAVLKLKVFPDLTVADKQRAAAFR